MKWKKFRLTTTEEAEDIVEEIVGEIDDEFDDDIEDDNEIPYYVRKNQVMNQSYKQTIIKKPVIANVDELDESDKRLTFMPECYGDWKRNANCELIYYYDKRFRACPKGKGIGTDAVITLMKYAFEEINLNRLDGSWIEYNIPSKKLYEKCGWYEEGTKKEAIYRNGQYHDLKIAGITRREYLQLKEKNNW